MSERNVFSSQRRGIAPRWASRACGRRRRVLAVGRAATLLVLAVLAGSCARDRGIPTYPNAPVVLISIDTLRADRLPAYGYQHVQTPYLDRFRQEAWLFENLYSPCPMTLPGHATMLSGLLPPENGVRNNVGFSFDGQTHPSIPALLRQHGYATGAAVSSYVLRSETGLGALFDYYEDSTDPTPGVAAVHYRRSGDKTAVFAGEWIAKHASEPFFFFFHIYEPHLPYNPPEPFKSQYGATYDAEVATSDAIVGAFLEDLKQLGVYDRAIVIVTSDHGEGLGDHGEQQHSILLYREAIHVPLLLRLPGSFGAGLTVATPAQLSDLLPTITALVGVETPKQVSGSSLLSLEREKKADRLIYAETLYPRLQLGWSDLRCLLSARYHYIYGPRPELYDIVADPAERRDLIGSEASTASRMAAELQRFPQGNERPAPVDQETLRRLAALGYIGGLRDQSGVKSLPNPVDNLNYLVRMQQGWQLAENKDYARAAAALRSILQDNPGMVDVWIKLGEVLFDAGFDEEATAAYQQALDRSPVFLPDISISLGYVELRRKRLPEADAAARRALEQVPTKAHELLARVALARGDFASAAEQAQAAVSGRNPQPSATLIVAEVRLRVGDPGQALEIVNQAEARARELKQPQVFNLEFLRADALARLNRPDEAAAAYGREIGAFPGHAQAYANLAVIYFIRGDRAGVDRLMAEMARANPSRRSYLLAAATYEAFRQNEKAARWRQLAEGSQTPATTR